MNDFYVTLPSNAGMDVYPDNAISHFTTRLRKSLDLSKEWEVALVEATVPTRWENVNKDEWIRLQTPVYKNTDTSDKPVEYGKRWLKAHISPDFYETTDLLVNSLNKVIHILFEKSQKLRYNIDTYSLPFKEYLKYDRKTNIVSYNSPSQLQTTSNLALLLGYGSDSQKKWVTIPKGVNTRMADLTRGWTNIFVYTDIVEYQIVGDTLAPLLRVIPMKNYTTIGRIDHYTHVFNNPHYVPIGRHFIETIHVDLMSDTGEYVPFLIGKSIIKLHFRKKSRI